MRADELAEFLEQPGTKQADAARFFDVSKQRVSRVAARLAERGYATLPERELCVEPFVWKDDDGITHGLRATYNNHGCKCEDCRAANAAYRRAQRG